MKVKVSTASGPVLDWMVAKCEGITRIDKWGGVWVPMPNEPHFNEAYCPTVNWAQGGPLIEREKIGTTPTNAFNLQDGHDAWTATLQCPLIQFGPTPLIAAEGK